MVHGTLLASNPIVADFCYVILWLPGSCEEKVLAELIHLYHCVNFVFVCCQGAANKCQKDLFQTLEWVGEGDGMVGLQMHKLLKTVYLSEVISHVCVFKWFKRFGEGCDSSEDVSSHCQLWAAQKLKNCTKDLNWWRSATHLIHLTSCLLPFFCSLSENCPKGRRFQDIKDNEKNITCTINTFLWMPSVTMLYNS